MRALFVGMGSIGQRHLANLRALEPGVTAFAVRRTGHDLAIRDGRAQGGRPLAEACGFTPVASLDAGLALGPDLVFVTNPTALHLDTALAAARAGCDLFIEKPLAHELPGTEELLALVREQGLVAAVGYQLRFHPAVDLALDAVHHGRHGAVLSAHFEWGAWLPAFHPWEDYRQGYAARADLGGGAALSLIHEIDLILALFGLPDRVHAVGGRLSSLETDVDDTLAALLAFQRPNGPVPVTLRLSLAQTREVRRFSIQMERATLLCDLGQGLLELFGPDGGLARREDFSGLERNELFLAELRDFLAAVRERGRPRADLGDGLDGLRLALALRDNLNL